LSKSPNRSAKELLAQLVDKDVPDLMRAITDDPKLNVEVKAARIGLANTALHHLRLLKMAME